MLKSLFTESDGKFCSRRIFGGVFVLLSGFGLIFSASDAIVISMVAAATTLATSTAIDISKKKS